MTAGMRVLSDSGSFQIDENYKNTSLYNYFVIRPEHWSLWQTATEGVAFAGKYLYRVGGTEEELALTAFRCETDPIMMFNPQQGFLELRCSARATVEVFQFHTPSYNPPRGAGLQVFKEDGSLAFDSRNWPLKIERLQNLVEFGPNSSPNNGSTYTIPLPKKCAYMQGQVGGSNNWVGGPTPNPMYNEVPGYRFNPNNNSMDMVVSNYIFGMLPPQQQPRPSVGRCASSGIFIDVTNIDRLM